MIDRYLDPRIKNLLKDSHKYRRWLLLEKEVFFSASHHLSIPESEILEVEKHWPEKIEDFEITQMEQYTNHDFVAFLRVLESKLQKIPSSKWIHYGLTSSDIIDSSNSLALKKINEILISELEKLLSILCSLSYRYLDYMQVGRTHGQHAEPISFGYKFAIAYQEIDLALEALYQTRRAVEIISIKGSTGSYSYLDPSVQEELANRFKLFTISGSTQTLPRSRYALYLRTLSLIGQIIHSLGFNLRTLSREEIGEIQIFQREGQVGSSSMPHKFNPVKLENISGLSRWLTKISELSYENMILWDERDISHSSGERLYLLDAPSILLKIINSISEVLDSLEVNKPRLEENLKLTKGLISSQSVLLLSLKSPQVKTRSEAHSYISTLADKVKSGIYSEFHKAVNQSSLGDFLSEEEIKTSFNCGRYIRHLPRVYEDIFKRELENKKFGGRLFSRYELLNSIHFIAQRLNWYYSWCSQKNDKNKDNNKVLIVSILDGAFVFSGYLLPLLNFPYWFVPLKFSVRDLYSELQSSRASFTQKLEHRLLTTRKVDDVSTEPKCNVIESEIVFSMDELLKFAETKSKKDLEFQKMMTLARESGKVLILDCMVDSGTTISVLSHLFRLEKGISEIKCATLIARSSQKSRSTKKDNDLFDPESGSFGNFMGDRIRMSRNFVSVDSDFAGPFYNWAGLWADSDTWLVGFGLDYKGQFRELSEIYSWKVR